MKRLPLALAATTLGLVAAAALPAFANAQTAATNQTDPRTALIQALVSRFHLTQSDVEQFFQEQEQVRAAEAQKSVEQRLTDDVSQGALTDAQKTAIIAKAKEARAKHEAARKLSREECKKMMDAYRAELEVWLDQQGIDRRYMRSIMGPPPGQRMGDLEQGDERDSGARGFQNGQDSTQNFGPQYNSSGASGRNMPGRGGRGQNNGQRRGPPQGGFGMGMFGGRSGGSNVPNMNP